MRDKLKELLILLGIDVGVVERESKYPIYSFDVSKWEYKNGVERIPTKWLRKAGEYLTSELGLYDNFQIVKSGVVGYKNDIPQLDYEWLCGEVYKFFFGEKKINKEKIREASFDIVVLLKWDPGLRRGSYYNHTLEFFFGNAEILPMGVCMEEGDAITVATHELLEWYFYERIWIGKEQCENPSCCLYLHKPFGHSPKLNSKLCKSCEEKLFNKWLLELKQKHTLGLI